MTILHDNLYTKRAVSALRGRNRYLSRAKWVKWVLPWRNRRLLQKKPEKRKQAPNLTTCSVGLSEISKLWNRWSRRPRATLHSQKAPLRLLVRQGVPPPVHLPAPLHPPVHLPAPLHPPVH